MREKSRDELDREVDRIRQCLHIRILESGMTVPQVAERSGINARVLSVIVRGDRKLRVWELLAILDAVGTTPQAFFQELYGYSRRRLRSEGGPL